MVMLSVEGCDVVVLITPHVNGNTRAVVGVTTVFQVKETSLPSSRKVLGGRPAGCLSRPSALAIVTSGVSKESAGVQLVVVAAVAVEGPP